MVLYASKSFKRMPVKTVVLDGLDMTCVYAVLLHIRDDAIFAFVEEPLEVFLVLLVHLIPGIFKFAAPREFRSVKHGIVAVHMSYEESFKFGHRPTVTLTMKINMSMIPISQIPLTMSTGVVHHGY